MPRADKEESTLPLHANSPKVPYKKTFLHVRNITIHNLGLDILKTKYLPVLRWGKADRGKGNLSHYSHLLAFLAEPHSSP